jgi:chorismate synthase
VDNCPVHPHIQDLSNIKLNKEDSDEDNVEFVEDTISTKSVPTYSQAQDAVETLTEFFENSDTSGGVFDVLSVIKGNL